MNHRGRMKTLPFPWGKVKVKTIESVSMLIPSFLGHISKYQCVSVARTHRGSPCVIHLNVCGFPKTNFVFTPKSILHIFSYLFDRQNQPSHL